MRFFVQYDVTSGQVVGILQTIGTPGNGETIPADFVEVTGRLTDGPFAGKIYNKLTDTFADGPGDLAENARKVVLAALLLKANATWTLADIAAWLKNSR